MADTPPKKWSHVVTHTQH